MELDQTVAAARKYNGSALIALLEYHAPRVQRLAVALCGEVRTGRRIVHIVMKQALGALPRLRDADAVERWFYHHTVLESRHHAGRDSEEALSDASPRRDPAYRAFVSAFRSLPAQQREAVLLSSGERLSPRYTGAAMDCSADAAANHLKAALQHLQAISGDQFVALLEGMMTAYRQLAPAELTARREVRRRVSRFLLPRRIRRYFILGCLLVIAYAVWHWRGRLRW